MGSSSQKNSLDQIYDSFRKKWVAQTPEEKIRQWLLKYMVEKLEYPPALIAVEKELSLLPHIKKSGVTIPKRRVDILVYVKREELEPLLMIECKAVNLTPSFAQQVIGYNAFVGAPFLALANEKQILTGFFDSEAGIYRFETGLPNFSALKSP